MRRLAVLVSVVVVLAGLLGSGWGRVGTDAQEGTPAPQIGDPIVGAWQWNADPATPELFTFAIFHADGTYVS